MTKPAIVSGDHYNSSEETLKTAQLCSQRHRLLQILKTDASKQFEAIGKS